MIVSFTAYVIFWRLLGRNIHTVLESQEQKFGIREITRSRGVTESSQTKQRAGYLRHGWLTVRYATLSFLPPPSLPISLRCPQARFRWVSYFSDSLGGRSLNGHIIALALALPLGALGRGDRGSTMLTVWPNALTACTECRAPPSRRPSMSDRHEALTVPG
jgi:hypothetical protein